MKMMEPVGWKDCIGFCIGVVGLDYGWMTA